ncbi:MAG: hypothetical protein KIT08_02125 [Anaerolineales bacterium]|nr:MAG: hypothetical protein KIT08_02125 [Anaerolineales bacterium]
MVTRYAIFGLTILLGLIASLYLGWELRPLSAADADPSLLREDYAADYALMAAEAYAADGSLSRAMEHLELLNADNALLPLVAAMEFGQEHGYSQADLNLLANLAGALRDQVPSLSHTPTP